MAVTSEFWATKSRCKFWPGHKFQIEILDQNLSSTDKTVVTHFFTNFIIIYSPVDASSPESAWFRVTFIRQLSYASRDFVWVQYNDQVIRVMKVICTMVVHMNVWKKFQMSEDFKCLESYRNIKPRSTQNLESKNWKK